MGTVGNDVQTAQRNVKDNNFTDQLRSLQLRQLQMALGKSDVDPLQAKIASIEKVLGRPLTDAEKQAVVGLQPSASPVAKYSDVKTDAQGKQYGVSSITGRYELIPGQDNIPVAAPTAKYTDTKTLKDGRQIGISSISGRYEIIPGQDGLNEVPPKPEPAAKPETEVFDNARWQFDPDKKIAGRRDPTGQYVRLGVSKEPGVGTGNPDVAALATDVAAGRASMPTGKFGAAVATYMAGNGMEPPLKKDVPADIKSLVAQPVPDAPSPGQSQRLAAAADKVFGGSEFVQDLMKRGKGMSFMGIGGGYTPSAYSKVEYQTILSSLQLAMPSPDLSDLGGH